MMTKRYTDGLVQIVERFIDYPGTKIVLPQSYRKSKRKCRSFAQQIITVTKNRIQKEWDSARRRGCFKISSKHAER